MMSIAQAPEPTSYVVEGESYRRLIAERDAYKRIANDLARQLRELTPADTSAPPERAAQETGVRCTCKDYPGADQFCTAHKVRPAHTAAHDCACAECVKAETRPAPEPPEKTWDCICGRNNYVTYTRCEHCGFQRATANRGGDQ